MSIAHGGQVVLSATTERLADKHVFQLLVEGMRDDLPPLRSLDAAATNLPVELTSFVGRDDTVKEIVDLLRGERRLVTIIGVGGVGKTRLALHVSAETLADFADGVWLCELAPVDGDTAVFETIATALGIVPRPGLSMSGSIVEWMRAKRLLLFLDNCEHLVEAVASFAETLLSACPCVRVLATSREALGVPGEQVWPLRSLATPDSGADAAGVAASPAAFCSPSERDPSRRIRSRLRHRRSGRGDLPAPRWHPAGDRTRRCACCRDASERHRVAARRTFPAPQRWKAQIRSLLGVEPCERGVVQGASMALPDVGPFLRDTIDAVLASLEDA